MPLVNSINSGQTLAATSDVTHNSLTLTNLTARTVVASNGINKLVSISSNTAGQVLTANGSASIPTFQQISLLNHYTSVNFAASPYTVLAADYYIGVDCSGGPVQLLFPNTPTSKQLWYVKDVNGNAGTNNITLTTPGGVKTFDGQTTYTMNANHEALQVLADPSLQYEIYAVPGIYTIKGDTGSATGTSVNVITGGTCGATVTFTANSNSNILSLSDVNGNVCLGDGTGTTSGSTNVFIGTGGTGAMVTTGSDNNGIGIGSLALLASGTENNAIGYLSLDSLTSGSFNIALGTSSGAVYITSESSNILLNSLGVVSESNVLRIGRATGTSDQNLSKAYICGIDGVNVGSVAKVVTMASDQLGTATLTQGAGITITPGANTITISASAATFTWNIVDSTMNPVQILVENGYICSGSLLVNFTLPLTPSVGDTFKIFSLSSRFTITPNGSQKMVIGSVTGAAGATGTVSSNSPGDEVTFIYMGSNTFQSEPPQGTLTVIT